MWRTEAPPGAAAQRAELGDVLGRTAAHVGVPADGPRPGALGSLRSRTHRSRHPYALDPAMRASPATPEPRIPQPFILSSLGVLSSSSSHTQEKRYNPLDPTLRFVDRADELDFLYQGFTSRRALMSCGHAVTPSSLTNWCMKLLDEGESRFVCGQTSCNAEWPYEEVCKMALLTPEEKKLFEKAMSTNAARANTKPCPGCASPVVRTDESDLRVHCPVCPATRGRSYDFCWQCLRPWKGPAPRSDHCGNDGCCNESLKTLQTCPEILLRSVPCPSIRACPTCGILLQRDNTLCKNVDCPRCKVEFCFLCLSVRCFHQCNAAARQTSVPVWQKK